ncbi:putative F-box/RNI/FBD-like domains-containing protein [Quillaja saponaria]|uniref:F-box/RNI/FBD-like domains-containing protein n=1 Tax=Quillaja saponaria TaxID=32244 RepID=A0AAD7QJ35_QUISA|nr:putative F-box/RNI/FBD-like domains-containing protein [Quillaja saponaria]
MKKSAESSSKRPKISGNQETWAMADRLSYLPDSLLCHILSLLPFKLAVATSILSKRWRLLWTLVPRLDLDDHYKQKTYNRGGYWEENLFTEFEYMRFAKFIYRVFVLREAEFVKEFRLKCGNPCTDPSDVNAWVCASINRNLEQLELSLCVKKCLKLCHKIFNCEKVVVLKLNGNIRLDLPFSVSLPSLKRLHLAEILYTNDNIWRLLSGCPVLEEFVVKLDRLGGVFNISVPTLRTLSMEYYNYVDGGDYKLEINAPSLEYFTLVHPLLRESNLENLDNLVEADLNVCVNDRGYVIKLLKKLNNVRVLSLSNSLTWCLGSTSSNDIPVFHNLIHLELSFLFYDWKLLEKFLQNSAMLQVLVIAKALVDSESQWTPPQLVPECLSSHLTMISFNAALGSENELEFAKYILMNAGVLKTMKFCMQHIVLETKARILKLLSNTPRGSATCQLEFS